jgi:hypothetical protein
MKCEPQVPRNSSPNLAKKTTADLLRYESLELYFARVPISGKLFRPPTGTRRCPGERRLEPPFPGNFPDALKSGSPWRNKFELEPEEPYRTRSDVPTR